MPSANRHFCRQKGIQLPARTLSWKQTARAGYRSGQLKLRELKCGAGLATGFRGFFLLGLFFLLFGLELVTYELKDGHLRTVTNANSGRNDAGVASRAVCELGRDLTEKLLRNAGRHDVGSCLPPRLQRVALPQRDHLFR